MLARILMSDSVACTPQKYLLPVLGRPNLKVLTDAFVFRVLSEKVGGLVEARGVEFEYEGKVHEITAAKEVIVCAG